MRSPLIVAIIAWATTVAVAQQPAVSVFELRGELTTKGKIDELVFGRLQERGIQPAQLCSDGVFVRRVYLDTIGTLPTATEARRFLAEQDPGKRERLVDDLLERPEFVDYWTMKWCDLLRVKAEFPINLWPNAVQAYQRWIRTSIKQNKPYDRFVRELLTASGSNFRVPPVNFYRALQSNDPESIADAVALTFMGARRADWPSARRAGMAAFFSRVGYKATAEWKEEIVYFDAFPERERTAGSAFLPDGRLVRLPADEDPREIFANWLITADNPWFTGNIVNRVWYWLLGRGIVHEPDDIRRDNPPSNPELLKYLQQELVDSGYDLKHLYRLILTSNTYQLSSIPRTDHPDADAQFAHYPLRRLDAEVLIDALCQISGTTESYWSPVPEPFTFIPDHQRSIALADGSITSSFLEMFGRPPRDTGFESERNNRPTSAQRLHMLNSSHIQRKIEKAQRELAHNSDTAGKPLEVATEIYLMVLSRFPTDEELQVAKAYTESGGVNGQQARTDLMWALINSPEFLYRH